jgi:hypothetical protein
MADVKEVLESHAKRGRVLLPMDEGVSLVDAQHLGLLINYAPRKRQVNVSESISYPDGSVGAHLQKVSLQGRRDILELIMGTNPEKGENVVNIDYNDDLEEDMLMKSWIIMSLENNGYEVNDDPLTETIILSRPEWK